MNRLVMYSLVAMLFAGLVTTASRATADDGNKADVVLKELEAVKMPQVDRSKIAEPGYRQQYISEMQKAMAKRGELILKLYKVAPECEKLPTLLEERWNNLLQSGGTPEEMLKEISEIGAGAKNEKIKASGAFVAARYKLIASRRTGKLDVAAVDEFIKAAPKDPRAGDLLGIAAQLTQDEKAKTTIEDRILAEFAGSKAASRIQGSRRQKDAVGKPFELEFTDAIKGSTVSMKGLKGKVVVIDFWATWCGPCVAEMPNMKELYAKYHDKGVEFIGVSLDQPKEDGGLDALKKYVKENEIAWPQYYQGNYWEQ